MTKFSWESLDNGSLLLRVTDGDHESTWKLTKRTSVDRVYSMLWEIQSTIDEQRYERVPGVNARLTEAELEASQKAWEERSNTSVPANTEEASMAALRAKADAVSVGAKWWDSEEEEQPFVAALPDYDTGEIS